MVRAFACLLALCALARAQPAPPPAADPSLEEAKRHFDQGVALYNDGNFNGALAEFEAAQRIHPTGSVLYNLGLTQKALFRYVESIDTLSKYLAESAASGKPLAPERRAEVENLIAEMRALLADVRLAITPDGAQVTIDGRLAGTAPLGTIQLPAGHHVIEVAADGYKPARREITLTAGQPIDLAIALVAIPKTGRVRVVSSQGSPNVRIDDRLIGIAPVEVDLAAGGHTLEVTSPGYKTFSTELVVAAGQQRTVPVELEKIERPSVAHKWWFWTVIGASAVGVALIVAAPFMNTFQDPIIGTLSPGTGRVN